MSNTSIGTLIVELDGGWAATGFNAKVEVDSLPSVSCDVFPTGENTVTEPASSVIVEAMAGLQKARLEGALAPNFSMTASIQGADGGSFSFSGFLAAPMMSGSRYKVGNQVSAVGQAAIVDSLDMSIYDLGAPSLRAESANALPPLPGFDGEDIIALFSALTDALVNSFGAMLSEESSRSAKQLMGQQHSLNQAALVAWRAILGKSEAKFPSLAAAIESNPSVGRALASRCKDMLTSHAPSFWHKLTGMLSAFGLFYVPEIGGYGRIMKSSDKFLDGDGGSVELSTEKYTISDGSNNVLTVGGVVISTSGSGRFLRAETAASTRPSVAAFYPPTLKSGYIHREPYPAWLIDMDNEPVALPEEVKISSEDTTLDLESYADKTAGDKDYIAELGESISGVLTDICRNRFYDLQLAHATAVIQTPLDFTMTDKVGKRVEATIKSPEGGGKFTGFVRSVEHNAHMIDGKKFQSGTSVRFSHVKF
jgi:hypothetical protein